MKNTSPLKGIALLCLMLAACGMPLSKNPSVPNTIRLERVFAPVDRFNCEGRLISSRLEEVGEPSKWVRIDADDAWKTLRYATVKNLSLDPDHNDGLLSYSSDAVNFQVHASNTLLAFHVKNGANEFEYAFYDETPMPGYSPPPYETGKVVITVTSTERTDPEHRAIYPFPEECPVPSGKHL
ncbi:MAG: hypothetical protein ABIR96_04065 [Bdellovibrionota bacterium]